MIILGVDHVVIYDSDFCCFIVKFLWILISDIFSDLKGIIVSLDEVGHLQCSYLGTDPAMYTTTSAEVRELDYAELDAEMKQLQKVIKEQQNKSGTEHKWQFLEQYGMETKVFTVLSLSPVI